MFEPLLQSNANFISSEDDVRRLFRASKNVVNEKRSNGIFRLFLIIFIVLGLAFIAINAPAFLLKSKFILKNDILNNQISPISTPQIPLPGQSAGAIVKVDENSNVSNNHIVIERIGVDAPINWSVEDNNDIIMKSLVSGVSHLANTSKPGEKGNVFIVGHSSNYSFAKGDYKTVFALLPDLVIGDKINIKYNNTLYTYKVTKKSVVSPNDVTVKEVGATPKLTLMTCVPLGTSLKRQIIVAEPADNKGFIAPQLPQVK